VPELFRWVEGDAAGAVAQKVTDVVSAVAGAATPEAVAAALADPAKAADLRLQLARIAADAEDARHRADLADMTASLAGIQDARQQTITLAQAHSALAWAPVVMSTIITVAFAAVVGLSMVHGIPPGAETLANMLLGTLAASFTATVQYWMGLSAGSVRKDATIAAGGGRTRPFGQ
jgi:hypothetical protein